jgi:GT2 family glycosyltransferase
MDNARASVIVLAWNGIEFLGPCLDALLAQHFADFEVVVVDNGSSDGSADFVAESYPQVRLIRNERNIGFAAGNNIGLEAATGEVLVLLNQDTEVHEDWLEALVSTFDDASIGIAGCKLLYPDGTIQHAGGVLLGPRGETGHVGRHEEDDGRFDELTDAEFVTAAALAMSRAALERVGALDEGFSPAYYEDIDWCYRARAVGFRVVVQPQAIAIHHESTATGKQTYARDFAVHQGRVRFVFKHWPRERLVWEFGPAEQAWAKTMNRCTELMAVRHAYLKALLGLRDILTYRASSLDEADALAGLLSDLRAVTVEGLERRDTRPYDGAPPAAESVDRTPFHKLQHRMTLREEPFSSGVPVFGKFIVAVRSLWNSVAAKWYVRPLVHQQNLFNTEVVSYLQGQSLDLAENIRELTTIAERLAYVEEEMRDAAPRRGAPGDGGENRTATGDREHTVSWEIDGRSESSG